MPDFLVANWAQILLIVFSAGMLWQKINQLEVSFNSHKEDVTRRFDSLQEKVHAVDRENVALAARNFRIDGRESNH